MKNNRTTTPTVLCFDFGATSARGMLCTLSGGKIELNEVHRFDNTPVKKDGTLYWDLPTLFSEMKTGIKKAAAAGGFDSIGIDTWGVDFALLDENNNIIEMPVHYRDARTDGIPEEVFEKVGKQYIYDKTGIQFMQFNTVFQLYYLKTRKPELLARAEKFIMMPDLFAFLLTGNVTCEKSIASTSQMLNAKSGEWDKELIQKVGLDISLFPEIVKSGTINGYVKAELCRELGIKSVPVYNVCGHDTASAVAAVPTNKQFPAYISCGTWSLLGTELNSPILTSESFDKNYTNESGYNDTIRYLKNIMGLWIINECRRNWRDGGTSLSYAEIMELARKEEKNRFLIDVDDELFLKPERMPEKIAEYLAAHNQGKPETIAQTARCVYDSLAKKYSEEIAKLEILTGKKFDCLHIIGGGCNADLLCSMAATACGIPVYAGPSEATVLGNAAVQFIAGGYLKNIAEARQAISISSDIKVYNP